MFIRGGSWAGYPVFLLFCLFFSKLFMIIFCFFFSFTFSPSLFKFLHLQSTNNTYTNKTNRKSFEKNIKKQHKQQKTQTIIISQPESERYLFAVGSRAGYPVFQFLLCFSLSFSVVFMFLSVFT